MQDEAVVPLADRTSILTVIVHDSLLDVKLTLTPFALDLYTSVQLYGFTFSGLQYGQITPSAAFLFYEK